LSWRIEFTSLRTVVAKNTLVFRKMCTFGLTITILAFRRGPDIEALGVSFGPAKK
jgi:hypothetical protein